MKREYLSSQRIVVSLALMLAATAAMAAPSTQSPPNIIFFVMDDVGIDQMEAFGYGGVSPPSLPNIGAIANKGIGFRNTWAMPVCSPSRAGMFTGRYPLRTNIFDAITTSDLANSQVSPYEVTTPKLLKNKGYKSGLFGKMHLTGSNFTETSQHNNPFGNEAYRVLGWDHFEGYLDGAPYPIDKTAGGNLVIPQPLKESSIDYTCGFVPSKKSNLLIGADSGACYTAINDKGDLNCAPISTQQSAEPGRSCMEQGGLFRPNKNCGINPPSQANFDQQNGYYTASWIINNEDGTTILQEPSDPVARGYRTVQEANRAISWIKKQSSHAPWMATIGFSGIHDPNQNVPKNLLPADSPETSGFDCDKVPQQRVIVKQMLEAIDHEIGRVLVETGIATKDPSGTITYDPKASNTLIVIIGDNGTYLSSVREPFDPIRAKGTIYQTGVWVPLIIAGPMVVDPGRKVDHLVNGTDLYQLFGEVAGLNVGKTVPKSHRLDAKPLLAYLTNPRQPSIRNVNYTQSGANIRASTTPQYPCVIKGVNVCILTIPQINVCTANNGTWYGPGGVAGEEGFTNCCQVQDYAIQQGIDKPDILPIKQVAIRNQHFKLAQVTNQSCNGPVPVTPAVLTNELYKVNEMVPIPNLDRQDDNLLARQLKPNEKRNFVKLLGELKLLEKTVVDCPGDGNLDNKVDGLDLEGWAKFSTKTKGVATENGGGYSSVYDFNLDGLTDDKDKTIIEQHLGAHCSLGPK